MNGKKRFRKNFMVEEFKKRQNMDLSEMKEISRQAMLEPNKRRDKAADYGSRAHTILEKLTLGHSIESVGFNLDPDLQIIVKGFEKWKKKIPRLT